jgi:hypothetical protein
VGLATTEGEVADVIGAVFLAIEQGLKLVDFEVEGVLVAEGGFGQGEEMFEIDRWAKVPFFDNSGDFGLAFEIVTGTIAEFCAPQNFIEIVYGFKHRWMINQADKVINKL